MSILQIEFNQDLPHKLLKEISEMVIDMLADNYNKEGYKPEIIYGIELEDSERSVVIIMDKYDIDKRYQESLKASKINDERFPKDCGKLYPFDE